MATRMWRRWSMAYVLLCALRRIALEYTEFAKATCKLLKIGVPVRTDLRRIKFAMASGCPHQRASRLPMPTK